ncbi:MAG: M20/M25/M40 family metallo-hydrolase [Bacteroidota bacterium]
MKLLKELCSVLGVSGDESRIKRFIFDYVTSESDNWLVKPKVISGEDFQENIILVFGEPKLASYCHIDTIGFSTRYENQLVPVGGPVTESGFKLVGEDALGFIECELVVDDENRLFHDFKRPIQRGTNLSFKTDFIETKNYVQSNYLDNRLGVYAMLKAAEKIENGVIVFSTWEEHGGGSVPYLCRYLYEQFKISKSLISDITWVTDGVKHGDGVAISLRDRNIPRKNYLDKILELTEESGVPYQLEVEASGSSDGRELQQSPYPIDWCFIGAAESNVHSPKEKVHKSDISSMIELYQYLFKYLK